jgi:hypothetical protein
MATRQLANRHSDDPVFLTSFFSDRNWDYLVVLATTIFTSHSRLQSMTESTM